MLSHYKERVRLEEMVCMWEERGKVGEIELWKIIQNIF